MKSCKLINSNFERWLVINAPELYESLIQFQIEYISFKEIKAEKISSDGVFFRCSKCNFEPEMNSKTDDLLNMNFCPNCGVEFE